MPHSLPFIVTICISPSRNRDAALWRVAVLSLPYVMRWGEPSGQGAWSSERWNQSAISLPQLSAICIPLSCRGDKLLIRTRFLPSFIELSDLKWALKDHTPVSVRGCRSNMFVFIPSWSCSHSQLRVEVRGERKINEIEKKYGKERNDKRMKKIENEKGLDGSIGKGINKIRKSK